MVHQFLCSLPAQPWEIDSSVDFYLWYSLGLAAPKAVHAYLHALFIYFERLFDGSEGKSSSALLASSIDVWPVTFTLKSLPDTAVRHDDFCSIKFCPLKVT